VHGKMENPEKPGCQWRPVLMAATGMRQADQVKGHIVPVKDVVSVVVARPMTVLRHRLREWWEHS
jgi:hypothetical protein